MTATVFTPQDSDTQFSAFATLADLAQTAPTTDSSPWMTHSLLCRCLLCR